MTSFNADRDTNIINPENTTISTSNLRRGITKKGTADIINTTTTNTEWTFNYSI